MSRLTQLRGVLAVAMLFISGQAFATAYTSFQSGDWNLSSTWSPTGVPGVGDTVTITDNHTITVSDARVVLSVTFDSTSGSKTLQITNTGGLIAELAASPALIIGPPATSSTSAVVIDGGTLSVPNNDISIDSGSFGGTSKLVFTSLGGTASLEGDIVFSGNPADAQIDFGPSGVLNLGGSLGSGGTLFTAAGGTLVLDGTGFQTVGGYTFHNFSLNKTGGSATLASPITVNGDLTIPQGLLDDGGQQISLNASSTSNVNIGTNGVLKLGDATTATTFPAPFAPANITLASNSAISYHAAVAQNIETSFAYGRLYVQSVSGPVTHTFTGTTLQVSTDLNILDNGGNAVTLDVGDGNLDVNGDIVGDGDITIGGGGSVNLAGDWSATVPLTTVASTTVTYDGTSAQSVLAATYDNLVINKASGTATMSGATTVNGDFTVTAGTFDTSTWTLNIAGNFTNNGTFSIGGNTVTITGDVTNNGTFNGGSGASTVVLNNTALQTWSGSAVANVNDLTLTNTFGVTFTQTVSVLDLTISGAGNATMAGSVMNVLSGGSATTTGGWVIGSLSIQMSAPVLQRFIVGTATGYSPVDVTPANPGTLMIAVTDGAEPNNTGPNVLQRWWQLSNNVGITSADLSFHYNLADVTSGTETDYVLAHFGSGWTRYGSVNVATHDATQTAVAAFMGSWTVGQKGSLGAAGKLAILSVNGGSNPNANVPFSVSVESQHDNGLAANVNINTSVDIVLISSGSGSLLGGTGWINSGTSSGTVNNNTYNTAETNVQVQAQSSSGESLEPGDSALFDVDAAASSITVTNVNDSGPGSLRDAIETHNSGGCTAPCAIDFSTSGTITLLSPLPPITQPSLTIDGYTAPGASANTNAFGLASNAVIALSLDGVNGIATGFDIQETAVKIRGFAIRNFTASGTGIGVRFVGDNSGSNVSGCYIGTDASGLLAAPNAKGVVFEASTESTLGGPLPADRNVISGNTVVGVAVSDDLGGFEATSPRGIRSEERGVSIESGSNTISISGNYIGTRADLTGAIANDLGIAVCPTCSSVSIGNSGIGNVIAGNTTVAIQLSGSGATVEANRIGVAGDTTTVIANGGGIEIATGSSFNTIGGPSPSDVNVISGSSGGAGLYILGDDNTVENNLIGVAFDGATAASNVTGISLGAGAERNIIGTANGNKIANNLADGIMLNSAAGIGNVFHKNKIYANAHNAIDIDDDGITPNDATDGDLGANNKQNFPTIGAAKANGGNIDVMFSLNSSSGVMVNFVAVEFFKADTSTPSQALLYLGSSGCMAGNVFTNTIVSVPAGPAVVGDKIVATATAFSDAACTMPSEGSSELSPSAIVNGPIHWINASGGNWETPANWNPAIVPTAGDEAFIDAIGSYTVNVNSIASVDRLHVGASGGTQILFVTTANAINIANPSDVTSGGRLTLDGNFGGTGTLDVTGSLHWNGGTISGVAALNINAPGTLEMNGALTRILSQRLVTIANLATATWNGGAIQMQSGGGFDNNGLFEIKTDATISDLGGDAGFDNFGTFRKTTTVGTTTFTGVDFSHTSGTLDLQTGLLNFSAASINGAATLTAGTEIVVDSDTVALGNATNITGTGTIRVNGGSLAVNGTSVFVPSIKLDSGTINGTGILTTGATGVFDWTGGSMSGSGSTIIASGGALNLLGPGPKTLDQRALTIDSGGSATLGGIGTFSMQNGATVANSGIFEMTSDASIINASAAGNFTNTSTGTFRKTTSAGTTTMNVPLVSNTGGTVRVQSGTFNPRTFTNNGTLWIDGTLTVDDDVITLGTGTTMSGTGPIHINGGTLTANTGVFIPHVDFDAGTFNGTGGITVGAFDWTGGAHEGTGSTTILTGNFINISGASLKTLSTRALTINSGATATMDSNVGLSLQTGATINNAGLFVTTGDGSLTNIGGAGAFTNTGTFRKSTSTNTTVLNGLTLDSSGTIDIQIGYLDVASGTNSSAITIAGGSKFLVNSDTYTFASGASASGSGAVSVQGGTLVIGASVGVSHYVQGAGTLDGTGTLTIGASGDWAGGTMQGAGTTSIGGGVTFTISGASPKSLIGRTLSSIGGATIHWSGPGAVQVQSGGNLSNSGLFLITADGSMTNGGAAGTFTNNGTLRKQTATGISTFGFPFTNNGTIDAIHGILAFNGFTQSSGLTKIRLGGVLPGTQHAQLQFPTGTPNFAGTLEITLAPAYEPLAGDNFRILSIPGGAHSGDFTQPYTYPALTGGKTFSDAYDASGLVVSVAGIGDLTVAKSAPTNVLVGNPIAYTIDVNNLGPDAANSVSVTDTLPAGHTGISAGGTGWSCNVVGLTVTCTIASIASGPAATITINATAPATPQSFINTATVSSSNDPNAGNNSDDANVTVDPQQANLVVSASGPTLPVAQLAPFTFTFQITNSGPQTANNVVFTAPIPSTLTFNSAPGCTFAVNTVSCTISSIPVGNNSTITINLTTTNNAGTHTVTGSATATEGDPNLSNNSATADVEVTGSTFVVTNTNDSGGGSLRQALTDAASPACTTPCAIHFNIGSGPFVIQPQTDLPAIVSSVTVDATTQPGYVGVPIVQLDMFMNPSNTAALVISGNNSAIKGLSLTNSNAGILINGNSNFIEANYIGLTPLGVAAPNDHGIIIRNNSNTIGGTTATARNVISGNTGAGIRVEADSASNTIAGNYIGTDPSGNIARPNDVGIEVIEDAMQTTIGGASTAHRNVISGNTTYGIRIEGDGTLVTARGIATESADHVNDTLITHNWIGPDASGINDLGATTAGIALDAFVSGTIIGSVGNANVISGNGTGITIGTDVVSTTISANLIGIAPDGTTPMGNTLGGIVQTDANGTTIGGTGAGEGNAIGNNGGDGVTILAGSTNEITGNSIFDSTDLGIDLGGDGITANDANDADSGPNGLQNFPVIASAALIGGGNLKVNYSIDASGSGAGSLLTEFFKADSNVSGEGMIFLGRSCVSGNNFSASATFAAPGVSNGDSIVATSTSYSDIGCTTVTLGTSEFSAPTLAATCVAPAVSISAPPSVCANSTGNSATASAPTAISYLWSITNGTITAGQGTPTVFFTAASSGSVILQVDVVDNLGCSAFTTSSFPITTAPIVNITGPTSSCTSAVLDAGPFASWSWSTGETTQTITVTSTGTYTVTVTNGSGCTATDSHTVTINTPPVVNITGPTAMCPSGSVTLDAGPFASYLWSTGETTQTITVSPASSEAFNVTVTDGNGCTGNDSHTVIVHSAPIATITPSGPTTFCTGGSVTLTANAGSSYLWSNGATTQSISVAATDTLTVSVTDGNGCTATSAPTIVTVNLNPVVTITGPTATCVSTPVTLDAGAGFSSYVWSNGALTQTISVSPASTAAYSVTVTDGNGCSGTDSHTVTVSANPVATITAPANVCSGASASASVGVQPGATYAWIITNGTFTSATNGPGVTFNANASGAVTLDVTVTSGSCTSNGSASMPIVAPPVVAISGPTSVCPNTTYTLSAGAGFSSYLWSNGGTGPSITVTQTAASQSYTVTVTNAAGCASTATHTVTRTSSPNSTISGPTSVDENESGLTASVPSQPGATYAWSIVNGTINSGNGTNAISFTAGSAGPMSVFVNVTLSGCTTSGTRNITVGGSGPEQADISIRKSAPDTVTLGATINYVLNVTNFGPSDANNVRITDPLSPNLSLVSISDGTFHCAPFNNTIICNGSLATNTSKSITITVTAPSDHATVTNSVTVDAGMDDPNQANNSSTVLTVVTSAPSNCSTTPPTLLAPADNATVTSPVTFSWSAVTGAIEYEIWIATAETTSLVAATTATSLMLPMASGNASWFVIARLGDNCRPLTSARRSFNVTAQNGCSTHAAPQLTSPSANSTVNSPVTFSWTPVPEALGYRVWVAVGNTAPQDIGTTDGAIMLTADVPHGPITAFVDALFNACPDTRSAPLTFNVARPNPCASRTTVTPLAPANNSTHASSLVDFTWTAAAGADGYRLWVSINGAPAAVIGTTEETTLQTTIEHGTVEWWVELLYEGCGSTESQHSRFTIPLRSQCATAAPQPISPANDSTVGSPDVTFVFTNVPGAVRHEVWLSANGATPTLLGSVLVGPFRAFVPSGRMQWFVRAIRDGCPAVDSPRRNFTWTPPANCRGNHAPQAIAPLPNATVSSPIDFSWSPVPGATSYDLVIARGSGGSIVRTTTEAFANDVAVQNGRVRWFVIAHFGDCPLIESVAQKLEVVAETEACADLVPPSISAAGQISSGMPFPVQWNEVPGANSYQLQIANNSTFAGAELITTNNTQHTITRTNSGTAPIGVYVRARAIDTRCTPATVTPYGAAAAIFILPVTGDEASAPLTGGMVNHSIDLGADLAGQSFIVTVREPWLTVTPSSGVVAPGGTKLLVTVDTTSLAVGTSLGAVQIALTSSAKGGVATNATTLKIPTLTISKVTPVTPAPKSTPPPDALIIPAVAHANGFNSQFQSDVRVTNSSAELLQYELTFTPTGSEGLAAGRQSTFSIDPGRTIALDDVLPGWFGTGGESVTGTLEIRPVTQTAPSTSSVPLSGLPDLVTFASSRTFNVTSNGTFGQYIPAIPFANFISGSTVLSLQQIAQSDRYRTNLGIVEGSGAPASLMVKVFGSDGQLLKQFPIDLAGGQHTQLNSFLATQGVGALNDGRVEISVVGGEGKVTAYASVLDNVTSDPLLVTPVALNDAGNTKWVVPGVADLNNGVANWQTDMRLFNAGATDVAAQLTFYSQNGGTPRTANVTIPAGQVRQFDKSLASIFGASNDGGAIHVSTASNARLVATARTYNQTSAGTYGQFISGVTPNEATGVGSRPLQILQVEESNRFRSNIGLAEVTGNPVKIEIAVVPPDGKVTIVTEVQLQANEFRQFGALLNSLGLPGTYNARVTVRAIEGAGRVTAYGSVIDMLTNDPTYVPAQ